MPVHFMGAKLYGRILMALALGFAGAAHAEPTEMWLSGVESSGEASYAYLGYVTPIGGYHFGDGLVQRYWVDWARYRYDKAGTQIDASAPGVEAALGWQQAGEGGWWAAYLGGTYRDTRFSPDDPANPVRGGMLRPKLQVEAEAYLAGDWRVAGIASYTGGQDAWYARVRALDGAPDSWRVGGEVVWLGDPSYRAKQYGAVVALPRGQGGWDFAFKLGVRQVGGLDSRGYFGLEAGVAF